MSFDIWLPTQHLPSAWDNRRRPNLGINKISNAYIKHILNSIIDITSILNLKIDDAYSLKLLAIQEVPKLETQLNIDFSIKMGPVVYSLILQLPMPIM